MEIDMFEKERGRVRELTSEIDSLWKELRKFPSNNDLRRKSNGNPEKYEELKKDRDLEMKEYQDSYDSLVRERESILKRIEEVKNSKEYLDNLWEIEGRDDFLKRVDRDCVSTLKENGFNPKFLLDNAKDSMMARSILICYESPTSGRGYVGYSMSGNAYAAYENYQKPLSKWGKEDLNSFMELFKVKTTLKKFKEFLSIYGGAGYHHTSKFYNKTNFYSVANAFMNCNSEDFVSMFGGVKGFTS